MILVGKFGWARDSSHGPSRRHPGLRLYTSREPQGRAPYYNTLEKLQETPSPFRGFEYQEDDPVRYQTSYNSEHERIWCEAHALVTHECWDEVRPQAAT